MGKKKAKAKDTDNPEAIKELGNKAFLAKDFQEAIKHYTQAIEMTQDAPNHIYFSNRANA